MKRLISIAAVVMLLAAGALADDGVLFTKNIPKTPELQSVHAKLQMMKFYVPAQMSDGTLLSTTDEGGIVYEFKDDLYPSFTRDYAKPLVAFYTDGHVDLVESAPGFAGHGERDIFGALSLDDGATWKRVNLSDSVRFSSINIGGEAYPGDVVYHFTAAAGNKVLAVWGSKFCQSGAPTYAIDPDDSSTEYDALVQMGIDGLVRMPDGCTDANDDTPCLYLDDLFAVAGSQRYSNLADEGYPDVGELPYSCLWSARGTLEPVTFDIEGGMAYDPTGLSDQHGIIWRHPERLTSGRRDVNRIEVAAVAGAGFVVTWQEDPDGLRPGLGEGPGSGFSGAIAHGKTDVWYSYLPWEAFDPVDDGDGLYGNPLTLAEYFAAATEAPKVGIPMAIPVRLTDNNKCDNALVDPDSGELKGIYCHTDFNGNGIEDYCESTVIVPTKNGETEVCIAEDGRLLRGNVGATRPRTNLRGYDSDGDGVNDSAWVVTSAEESKGLGEEDDEEADKIDMGKNAYFYTFDMFEPEIVSQGLHLNQPAIYPDWAKTSIGDLTLDWEQYDYAPDGESQWLASLKVDPIYGLANLDSTLYQTEIARRTSLITQAASKAGGSGMVGLILWKEGIIQRGGPADVMARRFVVPTDFDPMVDNPFDYRNMECGDWAYVDETNPRYLKGLCKSPPLNMSGTTIVACDNADGSAEMGADECAESFPWSENFDDYDMSTEGAYFAWLKLWRQCEEGVTLEDVTCLDSDLDDPTWENPFDLSKGHRGFMDGDFIMMLYAWSPNWKANRVGHDNYNFYVRRSFDGGVTWTTTPPTLDGDGTTHCETYRDGPKGDPLTDPTTICFTYGAGEFEQARDVSRFQTVHLTVLDPRYTPTSSSIYQEDGTFLYPDDERDHTKYVVSYETGDNTTTVDGEPEPLDMFYGRAYNWGDDYELFVKPEADSEDPSNWVECAPEDLLDPENLCYCDWLEHDNDLSSSEAVLKANPGGSFFYSVWSEEGVDEVSGELAQSDVRFRRVMWYFDESGTTEDGIDRVYDLSLSTGGYGSGTVYGDYLGSSIIECGSAGSDCQATLAENLVCDLSAVADTGYLFDEWTGDLTSSQSFLQLAMTQDWSLTALFAPNWVCDPLFPDRVITDMLCIGVDLEVACNSLEIQGTSLVTDTGQLTVVVGESVVLHDGFSVLGDLRIQVWPDLAED